MSIFEHQRWEVFSSTQHPYKHALSEFQYSNPAFGEDVTNAQQAMDWILAVLYPRAKPAVATVGDLPAVGNTVNDYRVVNDDGDGSPAGYRWEQREGEASASWHKVYDFDWSSDAIIAAYLDKTQDLYVSKYGRDDRDKDGNVLAGADAGQHVFGGLTAGSHLTLHANAGDGVGAQTGYIQAADNLRPTTDSAWSLGTTALRWLKVWTDEITSGTVTITGGSITDSSGAISFDNENLSTTGTLTVGTLLLQGGSITDSSGTIDFSNEHLTTTGNLTANKVTATGAASTLATGTTVGNLTLADGSITDSSGTISFNDENLTTTGTITGGQLNVDNLRLDGNTLSVTNAGGSLTVSANGAGVVDITSAMTTIGQTVTGTLSVTGQLNADNLRLDGNVLSSQNSNGNIQLDPNGTGIVEVFSALKPDTDNAYALGDATHRFSTLYLSGSIGDGTTTIGSSVLQSLRDINSGVSSGMSLFYDGSKWVASVPDTEVDHGTIGGLGDDDHTQYALLAGRSGGQTLKGGTGDAETLIISSTASAVKGSIIFDSNIRPDDDDTWDLGSSSFRFNDLYLSGQLKGAQLENYTTAGRPAASASYPGRVIWDTDLSDIMVDTGGTWLKVSADKIKVVDTATWEGSATTKTYTVDGTGTGTGITFTGKVSDARECVWALKDNSNTYEQMAVSITAAQTTVTITVSVPLPAGTYTLVGVG